MAVSDTAKKKKLEMRAASVRMEGRDKGSGTTVVWDEVRLGVVSEACRDRREEIERMPWMMRWGGS